jgi:predicted DNA-binding transcriptional regulator AlpA
MGILRRAKNALVKFSQRAFAIGEPQSNPRRAFALSKYAIAARGVLHELADELDDIADEFRVDPEGLSATHHTLERWKLQSVARESSRFVRACSSSVRAVSKTLRSPHRSMDSSLDRCQRRLDRAFANASQIWEFALSEWPEPDPTSTNARIDQPETIEDASKETAATAHPAEPSAMLGRIDLANFLKVSPSTIDRMTARGELPEPIRMGRCLRWNRESILDWMARGGPK